MNEETTYQAIKNIVDGRTTKHRVMIKLGVTLRTVNRLIVKYKKIGKTGFIHGNRGRAPAKALNEDQRNTIKQLYLSKYYDCTYKLFSELLAENEKIIISAETVRNLLLNDFILSPKTKKTTKSKIKKLSKANNSLQVQRKINDCLIEMDRTKIHPRKPRSTYFGEMIQMDASKHRWFGESYSHLHIAIDDATSTVIGAFFAKEETLNGYYHVLHQILTTYGIPMKFFTDNRTVFEYKLKNRKHSEENTFTQFSYACKQLGIHIETSSVAQAKGRVERLFNTLQSRIIPIMRLEGISSIDDANSFINSYIDKFNEQFSISYNTIKSVFEVQPDISKINCILAKLAPRIIDSGNSIKYKNKFFIPVDCFSKPKYFFKGTKALVIEAFDSHLYVSIDESIYALDEIPFRYEQSNAFVDDQKSIQKKKYIPPISHPWRRSSFINHLLEYSSDSENLLTHV